MTTKNIRAVTYLPPQYHKQLRQYMKQQKLSESAAIVEIIKQFFDEPAEQKLEIIIEEIVTEKLANTQAEISTLKTQMAQMQQLLAEAKPRKTPRKSRSQTTQLKVQPSGSRDFKSRACLMAPSAPLTPEQLAKRS